MESDSFGKMFYYLLLFRCQFSLLNTVHIPPFLILLSFSHVIFFSFILSLLDHLSFNFFSCLTIMQILNHDIRPNSCFFNIFNEIVTAFKKIFLSFCLEMEHFINYNACLMIVLSNRLYTVEHCRSLSSFLPHA